MAQIKCPTNFVPLQQVTAANLNAHVNSATLEPGSISEQAQIAAYTVAPGDGVLIYDLSATALRKANVSDILGSGVAITTGSITASTGANLVFTAAAGYAFSLVGNTDITGNLSVSGTTALTGNTIVAGTLTVTGNASFNGVEAVKIPVGTTLQRPATPVAGQMRFNSTINATEVYNGTSWDAVPVGGTSLTLAGTVNITGAIQYNGTAVYGLYEVFEETITTSSSSTSPSWTSSVFTKPSDEIWVFEATTTITSTFNNIQGTAYFLNTSLVSYYTKYQIGSGASGNYNISYGGSAYYGCDLYAKWVVNSGTALTAETVKLQVYIYNGILTYINASSLSNPCSKFRIYKYRTA